MCISCFVVNLYGNFVLSCMANVWKWHDNNKNTTEKWRGGNVSVLFSLFFLWKKERWNPLPENELNSAKIEQIYLGRVK